MKTSKLFVITSLLSIWTLTSQADITKQTGVSNIINQAAQDFDQIQSDLSNELTAANSVFPSNSPSTNSAVGSTVKDTINDEVVDILHGTKLAAGEIYNASKTAITKAVDFTVTQAPLVVTEFLHWKLAEAVIYASIWSIPAFLLLYASRAIRKRGERDDVPAHDDCETDKTDYTAFKWVTRICGMIIFMFVLATEGLTITKILVAPRVYLIEYVVTTVHDGVPPSQ